MDGRCLAGVDERPLFGSLLLTPIIVNSVRTIYCFFVILPVAFFAIFLPVLVFSPRAVSPFILVCFWSGTCFIFFISVISVPFSSFNLFGLCAKLNW